MVSDTSHRGARKAVSPPAARTKLRVTSSAYRHTRTPHGETHTARDAEANTRDRLEEGSTPRERHTPINAEPGLQPASGSASDSEPHRARAAMFTFTNQKNGVKDEVPLMGLNGVEEV